MDWYDLLFNVLVILLLIVVSGFLSGTETAMTGSSKARLVQLSKNGNKRASLVLSLLDKSENLIGSLLIGNNFVNILASSLATSIFLSMIGENGVFIATLVMTVMVVVFAEVFPKIYAMNNSDKMAMGVAPIINVLIKILSPVNALVIFIVKKILALLRIDVQQNDSKSQEEELRGAIELHDGDDPDYKHEREMLRSIMELDDESIASAMTHRQNVIFFDINSPTDTIINTILNTHFEKFPITEGSENIVGTISQKDVLRQIHSHSEKSNHLDIKQLLEEPWFVPESTSMLDQLQAFREKGNHFAIVVDEYGSYMGIITIIDILEYIVGEVHSEENQPIFRKLSDNSYIFNGDESIRNINRELDWDLSDEDSSTIAGYIIYHSKALPEQGQVYQFNGYEFTISKRERQKITKVCVQKIS